jgi:hypothetical protein
VDKVLNDTRARTTFFEAFVCGRMERAKLFADLMAVLQRTAAKQLREDGKTELAPLAHTFPPACPDSTCPNLLLDNNIDEPRGFRSPFGVDEGLGFSELLVSGSAQFGLRGGGERRREKF